MSDALPGRPGWLSFLPRFLFEQDAQPARYVAKAWPLALLPSLVLAVAAGFAFPRAEPPAIVLDGAAALFVVVVAAPLIETLLMLVPLLLAERLFGPGPAVVLSAAGWGVVHSLSAPVWGLVIWWPFLILSIAMLTWRTQGFAWMVLIPASIHALHNSVPAAAMLLLA